MTYQFLCIPQRIRHLPHKLQCFHHVTWVISLSWRPSDKLTLIRTHPIPVPLLNRILFQAFASNSSYQLNLAFQCFLISVGFLALTNTSKRFTKYKAEQYFQILMNPGHEFQFLAVDWDRKVSHKRQSYVSYL